MKIAFRADASINIGTGHAMRCLTLADSLRKHGAEVLFLCREEPGHLGSWIAKRGHKVTMLPARDGFVDDARDCLTVLREAAPWDWLVVDHYGLDAEWERHLRANAGKIMVIDDLADRQHDCDLLLDQNLSDADSYAGLIPDHCQFLIGPKYALLRPQFAAARDNQRPRNGNVSRLLVFFGGTDPSGETLKALNAIRRLACPGLAVDVVIGQANPHRAVIHEACHDMPGISVHCQVEDMASIMAEADLYVGAGGTSSWERCCLGLPALVLATADNQKTQSVALAKAGVQRYLGEAQSIAADRLADEILDVMLQRKELLRMAEQGKTLVDGIGAERVRRVLQS